MPKTDLMAGTNADEALRAFEALLTELEKVRSANYRSPLFTRWKQIVQTAFAKFLGDGHPHAQAFNALQFHGPLPKPPMEPAVSKVDKEAYEASMLKTAGILRELAAGLKEPEAGPPPAPAAAAGRGGTGSPATFDALKPTAAVPSPPPPAATGAPLRSTHDLPRHAGGIPSGGIRITSRSGVGGGVSTLEQFIEGARDGQERELLVALKNAMDDPACTWETAKQLLAELWWMNRETVQKILPIILRR